MDKCLIDSYSEHTEDSELSDEGKFESEQCQQRNRSSDGEKNARDDDGSISDIIELYNQDHIHQEKPYGHCYSQIFGGIGL